MNRLANSARIIPSGSVLFFLLLCSVPAAQKPEAADVLARHLESIGSAEARAMVRNRVLNGSAHVLFRAGYHGQEDGKFSFLSEARNIRLGMRFPNADYSGEQLAYDGSNATTGFIRPRVRSTLSDLCYQYDYLLREGLLLGSASSAWPLLDLQQRGAALEYNGLEGVEGRDLHEVRYRARRGDQDFSVLLYFDPDSYRHVRSKYRLRMGYVIGPDPISSSRLQPTYVDILEEFDQFRSVDGLTLPHAYKLSLSVDEKERSIMMEWTVSIDRILHNQKLDPKYFSIK